MHRCRNGIEGPGVGDLGKHLVAQDQRRFDVLNDLQVVQRPEDLLFVPAKAAWKSLVLITIFSASCRWSRGRQVASVLLQQLPLGRTEAVALPLSVAGWRPSTRGSDRDPGGSCRPR